MIFKFCERATRYIATEDCPVNVKLHAEQEVDQAYIENVIGRVPSCWHGASFGVVASLPTFEKMVVSEMPSGQLSEDTWLTISCCKDVAPVSPELSGWGKPK